MRLSRREFTLRKCPTREGSSACRKLPPMRRTSALREVPRLAAVRQRICEGDLLLGFCGKVPSKARRTRKSRGSLLCVNDRGLPQFDNALRRKSSPWLLRKSSEQGEENEEKPREFTLRKRPRLAAVRQRIAKEIFRKKRAQKNAPISTGNGYCSKVKRLCQMFDAKFSKKFPFRAFCTQPGRSFTKKMTTLLQLCAGFFTKVCYDIAR